MSVGRNGIVTECGPQPLHRRIEAVLEVHEEIVAPQSLAQFVPRDHRAGAFEQCAENLERLPLQTNA
jgi:hypothetical protein